MGPARSGPGAAGRTGGAITSGEGERAGAGGARDTADAADDDMDGAAIDVVTAGRADTLLGAGAAAAADCATDTLLEAEAAAAAEVESAADEPMDGACFGPAGPPA